MRLRRTLVSPLFYLDLDIKCPKRTLDVQEKRLSVSEKPFPAISSADSVREFYGNRVSDPNGARVAMVKISAKENHIWFFSNADMTSTTVGAESCKRAALFRFR